MLETLNNPPNLTAGALHQLPHIASRDRVGAWPWRWLPLDGSALSGGYPSGRVGFYSTVAGTKVHLLRVWDEANGQPTTPRGEVTQQFTLNKNDDVLWYTSSYARDGSYRIKGVRGERFEATLKLVRTVNLPVAGVVFRFGEEDRVTLRTDMAPYDGGTATDVVRTGSAVPSVAVGAPLWFRISSDGTRVTVRAATSEGGLATAATCYGGDFAIEGGGFALDAFSNGVGTIDDLTLKMDRDANGTYETTELVERFTLDADGIAQETPEYDAAGNLTYDGVFQYSYDAWNRQTRVTKAYRDDAGNIQLGSVVQQNEYDGVGRRIVVRITNSGDLDCTEHAYYDGWSEVET